MYESNIAAILPFSQAQIAKWCRRWDSNPHDRSRGILNPVRLPIPPLRQQSEERKIGNEGGFGKDFLI